MKPLHAWILSAFVCISSWAGIGSIPPSYTILSTRNLLTKGMLKEWARHSLDFFIPAGTCAVHLTHRGWEGDVVRKADGTVRKDRHIVATSRMAYGLAKGASLFGKSGEGKAYLVRAEKYADFILEKMVKEDSDGPYFVRAVDANGVILNPDTGELAAEGSESILNVEQQAYGLSGLVALYKEAPSTELLKHIERIYRAFYLRFHDDRHRGFYDRVERLKGPVRNEELNIIPKSFNSTAYVVSAFLYELGTMGVTFRGMPSPADTLLEVGELMAQHFPDIQSGWIVENFSEDWRPIWHGWQRQPEGTVGSVGHNFQAAWLLMQIAEWRGKYADPSLRGAAKMILESMLQKPGIDPVYGGFNNTYLRSTDAPIWTAPAEAGPNSLQSTKHWWQQVFGVLALSLAEKTGLLDRPLMNKARAVRDHALYFYERHFIDRDRGGELFMVKRDGSPIYAGDDGRKGAAGKSTHHTLQLSWYLHQYLDSPILPKVEVPDRSVYLSSTSPYVCPFPVGSSDWHNWYYGPVNEVNWYPGKHISGHLGGSPRRFEYPEIFGPPPEF